MGKILSWLVLAALVYLAFRVAVVVKRKPSAKRTTGGGAPPPGGESMVPCAHCGVHVPLSESVTDGTRHYCSAAHRDAG